SEPVRAWAVRLLCDDKDPPARALEAFGRMAKEDPSPRVRLALASALQRVPPGKGAAIAEGLVSHAEDAADASLPLLTWYGIEPLAAADPGRAAGLVARARIPLLRRFVARRSVQTPGGGAAMVRLLGKEEDPALRRDVLQGMGEAFRGRKRVEAPE